jgi:hypothetical protein
MNIAERHNANSGVRGAGTGVLGTTVDPEVAVQPWGFMERRHVLRPCCPH